MLPDVWTISCANFICLLYLVSLITYIFFHKLWGLVLCGLLCLVYWPSSETLVCLMTDSHLAVNFPGLEGFMGTYCRCRSPHLPSRRTIIQAPKRFAMVLLISLVHFLICTFIGDVEVCCVYVCAQMAAAVSVDQSQVLESSSFVI